jgi:hypothetical protein
MRRAWIEAPVSVLAGVIEHSDLPSRPVNYDLKAARVKRKLAVEIGLRRLS